MKPIVFIVGAGASFEAGLPLGNALKGIISNSLDFSSPNPRAFMSDEAQNIHNAIQLHCEQTSKNTQITEYIIAARSIRVAMPLARSIDDYIHSQKGNEKIEICAKLAIVQSILRAEANSLIPKGLYPENAHSEFEELEKKWFTGFFQLLTGSLPVDDLPDRFKNVSLIVFNYDRCIEQFMSHALQTYYQLDVAGAAELIAKLDIYHPYGKVGHLLWQKEEPAKAFGQLPTSNELISLAQQIRTFTEGTDSDSSQIVQMRNKLAEAVLVVFLGFGFIDLNMELLHPNSDGRREKQVIKRYYGTAFGVSKSDCEEIEGQINGFGLAHNNYVHLRSDLECAKLFKEYQKIFSKPFK